MELRNRRNANKRQGKTKQIQQTSLGSVGAPLAGFFFYGDIGSVKIYLATRD